MDAKHEDFSGDHCSKWGGIDQGLITPIGRLACEILVTSFRTGIYNLPIKWAKVNWKYGGRGVRLCIYCSGWATFDFDQLTRLVLVAHEKCVRVEVTPVAPKYMEVVFFQRHSRDGQMSKRHPTIETAIASL